MQGYDEAVQVSPRIRRLVAPNPSVMTGPGTNTYLIGTDDVAVIDPGPAIDEHIDHIIYLLYIRFSNLLNDGGPLRRLFQLVVSVTT